MFPITLQFKGGKISTCHPPCYGFLRNEEWSDWGQRFHEDSFAIRYTLRERQYASNTGIDADHPVGRNFFTTCCDSGFDATPCDAYDLSDLEIIWNSGANVPAEARVKSDDPEAVAWCWSEANGTSATYDYQRCMSNRPETSLDQFNKQNNTTLTVKEIMTDLEKAIDAGRESCLRFNEELGLFGVSTVDVPCDRALFYLMVHRELESFYPNGKIKTFLHLHYQVGIPIMIAFMVSRIVSYGYHDKVDFVGDDGDGCILPIQNFWVGCAARFKKPTAIEWAQGCYSDGEGHERDDDMGSFYMEPEIEGFGTISEEVNESMFNAVFGGYIDTTNGYVLLDRIGGKKVANLTCELHRLVATPNAYGNRGSGSYCSYWTSQRYLNDSHPNELRVKNGLWVDKVISLLTEE